jgi:DnaJ-class molecular chaperone
MNIDHLTTAAQVERYRKQMARYYHPDKWPADQKDNANQVMQMINENCDRRIAELKDKK